MSRTTDETKRKMNNRRNILHFIFLFISDKYIDKVAAQKSKAVKNFEDKLKFKIIQSTKKLNKTKSSATPSFIFSLLIISTGTNTTVKKTPIGTTHGPYRGGCCYFVTD